MMNKVLITLSLASLSVFVNAQELKPRLRTQTSYILAQAPLGLAALPIEGFYRVKRSLHADKWAKMMKKDSTKLLLAQTEDKREP